MAQKLDLFLKAESEANQLGPVQGVGRAKSSAGGRLAQVEVVEESRLLLGVCLSSREPAVSQTLGWKCKFSRLEGFMFMCFLEHQ